MMMTSLSPLMFAAKKKAVAKKPAAKQAPAKSAPAPKPIAEDNPAMLREDTEANREKAVRFLFSVMPFKRDAESKKLKGLQEEFVDFFKETGDYTLKDIQKLITMAQTTAKAGLKTVISELISIAREMGYEVNRALANRYSYRYYS